MTSRTGGSGTCTGDKGDETSSVLVDSGLVDSDSGEPQTESNTPSGYRRRGPPQQPAPATIFSSAVSGTAVNHTPRNCYHRLSSAPHVSWPPQGTATVLLLHHAQPPQPYAPPVITTTTYHPYSLSSSHDGGMTMAHDGGVGRYSARVARR
ncbi:hypothetical protein L1987_33131 [Smallanthus sonchifolius]|uniref:Uncharacterized protein n=1 Tax=Smallanthus sonchifolius TaxID=185202 RepID=A0ACB9HQI2_9ASTR|nr:hypothetical protein L1987_33131 [Smallanthus sonchifolius]